MKYSLSLLRHSVCGHGLGFTNAAARHLLEQNRVHLALQGHTGWEIVDQADDATITAAFAGDLTVPCGTCERHLLFDGKAVHMYAGNGLRQPGGIHGR